MKYCNIILFLILAISPTLPSDTDIPLHPHFNFTLARLNALIPELSFVSREKAHRFLSLASGMLDIPSHYLLLVDKIHPLAPDYEPEKMNVLSPDDFRVNKHGMRLDNRAYYALLNMIQAAAQNGVALEISSTYRSYARQKVLYTAYGEQFGEAEASRFSAPPGSSQHQLGTAVDFGSISNEFMTTPSWSWLTAHARTYGWSLSYPHGSEKLTGYIEESWHWRWIGADAARMQFEFFDNVQQSLLEFWNQYRDIFRLKKLPFDTLRYH